MEYSETADEDETSMQTFVISVEHLIRLNVAKQLSLILNKTIKTLELPDNNVITQLLHFIADSASYMDQIANAKLKKAATSTEDATKKK